jgi:hypothetical protein
MRLGVGIIDGAADAVNEAVNHSRADLSKLTVERHVPAG